jgi:hypothetical protein
MANEGIVGLAAHCTATPIGLRTLVRVWQLADWAIWQITIINAIGLLRCP